VAGFVLLPLLLLAGVELALRVAGYGYSTAFFKRLRIGHEDFLVENDKFGLRFFPPELARSPPPVVMKASKGPRVCRIFLLGESAALGDPRPAYGAGRYLEALLRERYPAVDFEVVCVAVTAINSHAVLPIARECAGHQGDLWILYMGNNEMVGPFGAATVFGSRAPPLWQVKFNLALERTRLGQLLTALAGKIAGAGKHGPSWGGMQMFMQSRIAPRDPRREVVYRNFRRNLEDILAAGRSAGVPIILSTVAVNLKDCPPFGSLLEPILAGDDRRSHVELCSEAAKAEAAGDFAGAVRKLAQAAELAPLSAELQFRWGECLLRLATNRSPVTANATAPTDEGKMPAPQENDARQVAAAARTHFELARDYDALPFRADSRLNGIIAQVAGQFAARGVVLCDAAAAFATNSPVGIPGQEAFYEHVHFNFDGNYLLARAWAEATERFLPAVAAASSSGHPPPAWASQAVCEGRLGLSDWNRYAVLEDVLHRLSQPPFTGQLYHEQQSEAVRKQLRTLRGRMDSAAAAQAGEAYLAALALAPADHRLHENFAQFLEAVGDLPRAAAEWQRVRALIPHHHAAWFQAGRLLVRQGQLQAGRELLLQAVKMRPDLAEGWLELGNLHAMERRPELALEEYGRARQLTPQDSRAYYHIGKALSALGRRDQAIESFRHALRLRPEYWEAHYALGEELAFASQPAEARKELEEVIRLKPDYPMAHLNLGVALAKAGDLDKARSHFEEAARLDPKNPQAREFLEKLRAQKR
jgi:tetratricopeptide (TPR) repeat protein